MGSIQSLQSLQSIQSFRSTIKNNECVAVINLDKIKFVGYAFQIEMKYRAFVNKFTIVEVPIIFTDRTKGQSKMSGGIIREAVVGVIMLRLRKIFNRL
jgi:dolichol-phosphate mannosyltransferase